MIGRRRSVLVTEAGSGIGFAVAEALVREHANVVLNGRSEDKLAQTAARISGLECLAGVAGDITQGETSVRLVSAAVERFGRVDVLGNHTGIFRPKPFTDTASTIGINFLAACTALFFLRKQPCGRWGAAGTGRGDRQHRRRNGRQRRVRPSVECADRPRGGIVALTTHLSVELATEGIRSDAVAPGIVHRPLLVQLWSEQPQALKGLRPLGSYRTPKEIADAVPNLATATWVTGVILPVDGGVDRAVREPAMGPNRISSHPVRHRLERAFPAGSGRRRNDCRRRDCGRAGRSIPVFPGVG